jgi:hypothetical protein
MFGFLYFSYLYLKLNLFKIYGNLFKIYRNLFKIYGKFVFLPGHLNEIENQLIYIYNIFLLLLFTKTFFSKSDEKLQ